MDIRAVTSVWSEGLDGQMKDIVSASGQFANDVRMFNERDE